MINKLSETGKEKLCCAIFFVLLSVVAIGYMGWHANKVDAQMDITN